MSLGKDIGSELEQRLGPPSAEVWTKFMAASLSPYPDPTGWVTVYSDGELWDRLDINPYPVFSATEFLKATGRLKLTQVKTDGNIKRVRVSMKGRRSKRRHPPQKMREYVMCRDNHTCRHCGTTENPSIDHVIPWSLGGPTTPTNLQVLCHSCNASKGNRGLD